MSRPGDAAQPEGPAARAQLALAQAAAGDPTAPDASRAALRTLAYSVLPRNLSPSEWLSFVGPGPARATCPGLPVVSEPGPAASSPLAITAHETRLAAYVAAAMAGRPLFTLFARRSSARP